MHEAAVAGSIPGRADCNQGSCFLPIRTAVVLCKSLIGYGLGGESDQNEFYLTLREVLL